MNMGTEKLSGSRKFKVKLVIIQSWDIFNNMSKEKDQELLYDQFRPADQISDYK